MTNKMEWEVPKLEILDSTYTESGVYPASYESASFFVIS